MTPDHPEPDFTGLDADRPLRPDQVARLEAGLLGAAAALPAETSTTPGSADTSETLLLDGPRPLPADVRDRVEAAVLGATVSGSAPRSVATGGAVVRLVQRRPSRS